MPRSSRSAKLRWPRGWSIESLVFLSRNCPSCNAPAADSSPEVRAAAPAEALPFDDLVPSWRGFFKVKPFFTYHRCRPCGQLYSPSYFTGEQLEKLYASMPENMEVAGEAALRATQRG